MRQAILETLGWKLLRVWSTDWWVDKAAATEKLHLAILRLLEEDRARQAGASGSLNPPAPEMGAFSETIEA